MAKVEFDPGIESVRGILMGTDPFYIRRYPQRGGGVMHIVQARPDRSGHIPTAAESTARITFAEKYGRQKHLEFLERKYRGQLFLPFEEEELRIISGDNEQNRHPMPGQWTKYNKPPV